MHFILSKFRRFLFGFKTIFFIFGNEHMEMCYFLEMLDCWKMVVMLVDLLVAMVNIVFLMKAHMVYISL